MIDRVSKDEYWAREKKEGKDGEDAFFGEEGKTPEKKEVEPQRLDDQKSVDRVVLKKIGETEGLKDYLGASFSLRSGERPHEMVF